MQDQILSVVDIKSGIVKEQTPKAAEGYWTDADKVRFRFNKPELIGGWQNVTTPTKTATIIGYPRAIETARTLAGTKAAVVATHQGVYSSDLSQYYDITPIVTTIAVNNVFSTLAGSSYVTVSVTAHGLVDNTLISLVSAATSIGGNIKLNADTSTPRVFPVVVVNTNSYKIDTSTTAAATSAATGGNATIKQYVNAGLASSEFIGGYGTGYYSGNVGFGTSPSGTYRVPLRLWSLDLWGTNMMAVPSRGPLYLWDTAAGITTRLAIITAAPSVNQIVRVASEARHVVLYGTHDTGGTYDPLLIRWCDQEDYTTWTPTAINTAGDNRLQSRGSEIRSVNKMADKTAILTDADLFIQTYIGGNDVFGFVRVGENCGAYSQNSAVEYGGVLYWISNNGQFYKYDGRVQPLASTVLRYVFQNVNPLYYDKIVTGVNSQFDEIIFFYPTYASTDGENNCYAIYNVVEQHWTIGTLCRTAWMDRNTFDYPLAAGNKGEGLFYHEVGYSANGTPLNAYVHSAYFDMASGDQLMFCNKIVPDFNTIPKGTVFAGNVNIYLYSRRYPGSDPIIKGPYPATGTTKKISTRQRGREFAIRFESNSEVDKPWRMGEFRLAIEPDGKR